MNAPPLTLALPPEFVEQIIERAKAELRAEFGVREPGWPEWMDVPTAARYMGTTVPAIRKLYEQRRVPHSQDGPGCKVWIARADLDAYLLENRRQ